MKGRLQYLIVCVCDGEEGLVRVCMKQEVDLYYTHGEQVQARWIPVSNIEMYYTLFLVFY